MREPIAQHGRNGPKVNALTLTSMHSAVYAAILGLVSLFRMFNKELPTIKYRDMLCRALYDSINYMRDGS